MSFASSSSVDRSNRHEFISQIIYPSDLLSSVQETSLLIGWNQENFRCTIASVVPLSVANESTISAALNQCGSQMTQLLSSCSISGRNSPIILGEARIGPAGGYQPESWKQGRSIWITLVVDGSSADDDRDSVVNNQIQKPELHSLYSLGCLYQTSCYMFAYSPASTSRLECFHVHRPVDQTITGMSSAGRIVDALHAGQTITSTDLQLIVNQVNAAEEVGNRLHCILQSYRGVSSNHNKFYYSAEAPFSNALERFIHQCAVLSSGVLAKPAYVWCRAMKICTRALNHKYVLLHVGLGISNWLGVTAATPSDSAARARSPHWAGGAGNTSDGKPTTASATGTPQGLSWRDLSLTFAYIYERCARSIAAMQMCSHFCATWNLPAVTKQYLFVQVMSQACSLLVDMVLGVVFGWYLYHHAESIADTLSARSEQFQATLILDTLEWFNHSPVGIKLNPIITRRMGSLLTVVVRWFSALLTSAAAVRVPVVCLVACIGALGLSVQLVLIVDLMRLLTFHIATIHRVLSSWHHFMLQCLHSLWLLFQGQKNNILRRRIDTCVYEQDQLLVGIVFFSIALFLFPNFAAYFLLFALAQLGCVVAQYLVYSLSVVVKEFPVFEAVMYLCYPGVMTDGVQFKVLNTVTAQTQQPAQETHSSSSSALSRSTAAQSHQGRTKSSSWAKWASNWRQPRPEQNHAHDAEYQSLMRPTKAPYVTPETGSAVTERQPGSADTGTGLRGILKSREASNKVTEGDGVESAAAVTGEGAKGRVSFQTGTVRSIPQYHSDDGSAGSAGSDLAHEFVDAPAPIKDAPDAAGPKRKPSISRRHALTLSTGSVPSSSGLRAGSSTSRTAHIQLTPRLLRKTRLFAGYMHHMFYFSYEKGLFRRLAQGVVLGRPALDIQMIHGTCDIADRREAAVQGELARISSVVAQLRQSSGKVVRSGTGVNGGGDGSYWDAIGSATAGEDELYAPAPSSKEGEMTSASEQTDASDALLSRLPSVHTVGATGAPLHSRACRTYSRVMLLTLLVAIVLQMVLCVLAGGVFVHSVLLARRGLRSAPSTGVLPVQRTLADKPSIERTINLPAIERNVRSMRTTERTINKSSYALLEVDLVQALALPPSVAIDSKQ